MEKPKSERDKRLEQGENLLDFLCSVDSLNLLKRLKGGKENEVTFDEFKDFILKINAISRGIDIANREFDGENVLLKGFVDTVLVPKQEDKENLIELAYDSKNNLKYPEDVAYLLPVVLNAVHAFLDGNGRTSRVLNLLFTPDVDLSNEEFKQKILLSVSENGRFNCLDISPSLIETDIENLLFLKHGMLSQEEEFKFPDDLTATSTIEVAESDGAKRFLNKFRPDRACGFIALYEYLKRKDLLNLVIKTKSDFSSDQIENNYKAISLSKMDSILSDADWVDLLEDYYKLKRESVEILIDIFVHPDDYRIKGTEITLRDSFIDLINKRHKEK